MSKKKIFMIEGVPSDQDLEDLADRLIEEGDNEEEGEDNED